MDWQKVDFDGNRLFFSMLSCCQKYNRETRVVQKLSELQLLERIVAAQTPQEIIDIICEMGFNNVYMQRWQRESLYFWQGNLPDEFTKEYFIQRQCYFCPVIRAIQSGNRNFLFSEVLTGLREDDEEKKEALNAYQLFLRHNIRAGAVILSGRQDQPSSMIVTAEGAIDCLFDTYEHVLNYAASRLHNLLPEGHEDLHELTAMKPHFSEMQRRIIQIQISYPQDTLSKMALRLGISPKTLVAHQKKIAKKSGVYSYTGAIIQEMKSLSVNMAS